MRVPGWGAIGQTEMSAGSIAAMARMAIAEHELVQVISVRYEHIQHGGAYFEKLMVSIDRLERDETLLIGTIESAEPISFIMTDVNKPATFIVGNLTR